MESDQKKAMLAVVLGATIFGFLGISTRFFNSNYGLNSMEITAIRLTFASIFLLLIMAVLARDKLKIRKQDIPLLFVFGIFKIASDVTFFYSQTTIQLGLSTLLQMTAPYYVMLISLVLFRERLTWKKLFALSVGTIGAIFVTDVLFGEVNMEIAGVLSAIASGLFFGLFLIGGRLFNQRGIHPATSLFYTFLFADCIALPFCFQGNLAEAVFNVDGFLMCLALGILMTLVPFFLYTWSTQYIVPTLSSMISVLEVVTATLVGFFIFGENVSVMNIIGMSLVILSIILMNIKLHSDYRKKFGEYIPDKLKPFRRKQEH